MKYVKILHGISAFVFIFAISGCNKENEEPFTIKILATENFEFVPNNFEVTSGQEIIVTLKNEAIHPSTEIEHNFLIVSQAVDYKQMLDLGINEESNDYIPTAFNSGIIVRSQMLQPNTNQTIRFTAPKMPGNYKFICSFPGHCGLGMNGTMKVTL